MSQRFRDCGGKSIYKSTGASCNTPSDLYDQKNQVDSILEYMTQGLDKIRGIQGFQGDPGLDGAQGIQGIQGLTGTQGTHGIQGLRGLPGIGIQGNEGIQGPAGSGGSGPGGTTVSTLETSRTNSVVAIDNLTEVNPSTVLYDGAGDQDEVAGPNPIGFDVEILGQQVHL